MKVLCVTMLMLRASGFLRFFSYFVCDCRMRESVLFVSRRCGLVGRCWLEVAWEGVLFFLFFDMFERRITREREREREGGLELEQI